MIPDPRFPPARSALSSWMVVIVLLCAYAVSFVDRQIVNLLVDPIRTSLSISDTQIGMLQGPAFGLFYAILGLPLGWLADRVHRLRLIAAGIALWSVMTILCGLAESYPQLFLARMGVGVGEAVLVPAAVSLIADLFHAPQRALPMSVFTSGLSLGSGLALLLGGWFIGLAGDLTSHRSLGLLSGLAPWQVAFCLAGVLGFPVVVAVLLLREPHRAVSSVPSLPAEGSAAAYIVRSRRLFAPLLFGTALLYLFSYAFTSWMPTIFIRQFGWPQSRVGGMLAVPIMLCAMGGNLASGIIATRLARAGRSDATLRTMIGGGCVMIPATLLVCFADRASIAMIGVPLIFLGLALCFGVATTAFVTITPPALRGRVVATYLTLGNMIGLGLGPPVVGFLVDRVLQDPRKVGTGLLIVATATIVPGILLLAAARRPFETRARQLADE